MLKCQDDHVRSEVKTIRVKLNVLDAADATEMLDRVTKLDGVVAALLDLPAAALEVVVARSASALLVREQLRALTSVGA